jgi:hypothetical protein
VLFSLLLYSWFGAPIPRKDESMEVNSMGKMYLVEGLVSRDLGVSQY